MIRYIHGSSDSIDIDTVYVFDSRPLFKDAKKFCDSKKDENANIICVTDGKVSYCYKGAIDEINNSLIATYPLHEQEYPLIIKEKVERDRYLKLIRSTRTIIGQFSRTNIRPIVKKGLNGNWDDRIKALSAVSDYIYHLNVCNETDALTKGVVETFKKVAFQVGQTLALFKEGKELYTKDDVSERYPGLRQYLDRRPNNSRALKFALDFLICKINNEKYYTIGEYGVVFYNSQMALYDIHHEEVIVNFLMK